MIDKVGEDNVMFETDFPHPTALWPKPLEHVHETMATLRPGGAPEDPRREREEALPPGLNPVPTGTGHP